MTIISETPVGPTSIEKIPIWKTTWKTTWDYILILWHVKTTHFWLFLSIGNLKWFFKRFFSLLNWHPVSRLSDASLLQLLGPHGGTCVFLSTWGWLHKMNEESRDSGLPSLCTLSFSGSSSILFPSSVFASSEHPSPTVKLSDCHIICVILSDTWCSLKRKGASRDLFWWPSRFAWTIYRLLTIWPMKTNCIGVIHDVCRFQKCIWELKHPNFTLKFC